MNCGDDDEVKIYKAVLITRMIYLLLIVVALIMCNFGADIGLAILVLFISVIIDCIKFRSVKPVFYKIVCMIAGILCYSMCQSKDGNAAWLYFFASLLLFGASVIMDIAACIYSIAWLKMSEKDK